MNGSYSNVAVKWVKGKKKKIAIPVTGHGGP
jgi:hypothetical protein